MFVFTCLGTPFKYLRNLCLLGNQKATVQHPAHQKAQFNWTSGTCRSILVNACIPIAKTPSFFRNQGSLILILTMSYFHWKYNQLSSAIRCFTVLFGMGRSGTTSLWSSGKGFAARAANSLLGQKQSWAVIHWLRNSLDDIQSKKLHGYRIKLHEQLVMVSWVPHSTYTPILSTSWSRTTL